MKSSDNIQKEFNGDDHSVGTQCREKTKKQRHLVGTIQETQIHIQANMTKSMCPRIILQRGR